MKQPSEVLLNNANSHQKLHTIMETAIWSYTQYWKQTSEAIYNNRTAIRRYTQ